MATQHNDDIAKGIQFTPETLAAIAAIVAEMKKPVIDEVAETRLAAAKQRLRDQRDEATRSIKATQDSCNHLRPNGSCNIAWIEHFRRAAQRYVVEGFCQVCNKHYEPGVEGYAIYINLPRGNAGLVS